MCILISNLLYITNMYMYLSFLIDQQKKNGNLIRKVSDTENTEWDAPKNSSTLPYIGKREGTLLIFFVIKAQAVVGFQRANLLGKMLRHNSRLVRWRAIELINIYLLTLLRYAQNCFLNGLVYLLTVIYPTHYPKTLHFIPAVLHRCHHYQVAMTVLYISRMLKANLYNFPPIFIIL